MLLTSSWCNRELARHWLPDRLSQGKTIKDAELDPLLERYIKEMHPEVFESLTTKHKDEEVKKETETDVILTFDQVCTNRGWDMWDQTLDDKMGYLLNLNAYTRTKLNKKDTKIVGAQTKTIQVTNDDGSSAPVEVKLQLAAINGLPMGFTLTIMIT